MGQVRRKTGGYAKRIKAYKYTTSNPFEALRATIKLIGNGIKDGAVYIPLRMHAAKLASRARPKDYLGQVKSIYSDFVRRWRYVQDPLETELVTVSGPALLGLVIGLDAPQGEHGFSDCDEACAALGALYRSVGFPVLINTIEKPTTPGKRPGLFSHVYPSVKVPNLGWLAADAVGHPKHKLGWFPSFQRLAAWDLDANLVAAKGHFPAQFREMLSADISGISRRPKRGMR